MLPSTVIRRPFFGLKNLGIQASIQSSADERSCRPKYKDAAQHWISLSTKPHKWPVGSGDTLTGSYHCGEISRDYDR